MMQEQGGLEDKPEKKNTDGKIAVKKVEVPPMENTLPADLRMDEYSDDEEDDVGFKLGNLIGDKTIPIPDDMVPEDAEESEEEEDDQEEAEEDDGDDGKTDATKGALNESDIGSDGESDDDDDDLADVPDTREFDPVDVEGLEAMGLSHINGAMYMDDLDGGDDDDSEADNVRLTSNDAVIVVAKTEEVSCRVGAVSDVIL